VSRIPQQLHFQACFLTSSLLAALLLSGCSRTDRRNIEPVYDEKTGRLQLLKYDANGNGRTDTLSYMDGARVLRIEIDRDEDGRTERWEYYGPDQKLERVGFSRAGDGVEDAWSYAGPDGSILRIDVSTRRDGRVSRTERYVNETMVGAEEDTNGDGAFDKWETFDGDRLASVAFDTTHRGKPDRRLVYGAGGAAHLEIDSDGDGRFTAAR
jgi:hypothetical protein